jgi:hypothetical protein
VKHHAQRSVDFLASARHRALWGSVLLTLGLCGYVAGLACILVPVALSTSWLVRLPAILSGSTIIGMSYGVVAIGRRLRIAPGDWDALAQDPRAPIVYLRPFELDGAEQVSGWGGHGRMRPSRRMIETTYEERLVRALADVGPVVAIADPSDELLEIGADRLRAADWEWQYRVAELTERAQAIILHAGASDGLAWEIEHVVGLRTPERMIVALPLDAQPGQPSRQERYAHFVRATWELFPRGLPDRVGESTFLYFDRDWKPHRFGHRGASIPAAQDALSEQCALALTRLGQEFGEQLLPFWARALLATMGLMVAGVVVGTAVYAVLA